MLNKSWDLGSISNSAWCYSWLKCLVPLSVVLVTFWIAPTVCPGLRQVRKGDSCLHLNSLLPSASPFVSLPIHPSFLVSSLADSHGPVFLSLFLYKWIGFTWRMGILLDTEDFFPFCFFFCYNCYVFLEVFFSHHLCLSSPLLFPQQHKVGYLELSRWQLFEFPLLQQLRKGEVTENLLQFLLAFREPYLP